MEKKKYILRAWEKTGISFHNWIGILWAKFNDNSGGIAVIIAIIAIIIAIVK